MHVQSYSNFIFCKQKAQKKEAVCEQMSIQIKRQNWIYYKVQTDAQTKSYTKELVIKILTVRSKITIIDWSAFRSEPPKNNYNNTFSQLLLHMQSSIQ